MYPPIELKGKMASVRVWTGNSTNPYYLNKGKHRCCRITLITEDVDFCSKLKDFRSR